jgi:hypothetical protein
MKTFKVLVMTVGMISAAAAAAPAQDMTERSATLRAGGLMYDRGGDATKLMLGAGMDWTLSRHVLAEVEGTWASFDEVYYEFGTGVVNEFETSTHLATATAGVQAQALLGRVRPYVGMSAGLFVRYDEKGGGDRFINRTFSIPAGLRVDVTDRFAVRGELRARFDTHQDGGSGTNVEQTLGVSFRF